MAKNLNVGTMINSSITQTNNSSIEKYCYDNNPANCTTYGGLYQWNEMMQYSTTEGTQGVCPTGWHLPSDDEYKTLEMELGMTQAQADDRGTDQGSQLAGNEHLWNDGVLDQNGAFGSSGFLGLPAGLCEVGGCCFSFKSTDMFLWSSSEDGSAALSRELSYNHTGVSQSLDDKAYGSSVRCVKD